MRGAGVLLDIASVAAPDINKIFDVDGTIIVNDMTDTFYAAGRQRAKASSRRASGPSAKQGPTAQGLYPYLYRIDATKIKAVTAEACVSTMNIDFGPIVPMDYDGNGRRRRSLSSPKAASAVVGAGQRRAERQRPDLHLLAAHLPRRDLLLLRAGLQVRQTRCHGQADRLARL